ncbi:MAG: hypothetical protein H0U53_03145 [Actinobacteria bacterium]|nr:hypothetical protein [Actinomycetota bacterium]
MRNALNIVEEVASTDLDSKALVRKEPTPKQLLAAELLCLGRPIKEIMVEVGIARSTLTRWRGSETFRSACSRMQEEIDEQRRQRLLTLSDEVVTALEQHLREGDVEVALELFRAMQGRRLE